MLTLIQVNFIQPIIKIKKLCICSLIDMPQQTNLQGLFDEALKKFEFQEFEQALELINKCIEISPQSPDLLTNRSLIQVKFQNYDQAVKDLQNAIEYCPYNYVPYFNLSSVYYKMGNKHEAVLNIYCSMSCLCVKKCQFSYDSQTMTKALCFTTNNIQGFMLQGLENLKHGNTKDCLYYLDKALSLDDSNSIIQKIHESVYNMRFPYHEYENPYKRQENQSQQITNKRLKCAFSYEPDEDMDEIIHKVMTEFNQLLSQVKILQANFQGQAQEFRAVNQFWDLGEDKTFEIRKSHK